ncbi:SH3 domain-containing protein [Aurantivibrio plasticivorans]
MKITNYQPRHWLATMLMAACCCGAGSVAAQQDTPSTASDDGVPAEAPAAPAPAPEPLPVIEDEKRSWLTAWLPSSETIHTTIVDPFVNMRTGPGRGYPINHIVERGEPITLLKKRNDWIKVETQRGVTGWTHRDELVMTLSQDGKQVVTLTGTSIADYETREWSIGVGAGEFGGSDALTLFGTYRMNDNFTIEGKFTHSIGSFSERRIYGLNLTHEIWPHWRVSPFLSIGAGIIEVSPDVSLADPVDRQDSMMMIGAGVQTYISRQLMLRVEYTNNVILPSRNENEEVTEWKIGLSAFF